MDQITTENEIKLTPAQLARKKYYERIKHTDEYKEKRRLINHQQYHIILKHNEDFKRKVSEQKKEYYMKNKTEKLLDIIITLK